MGRNDRDRAWVKMLDKNWSRAESKKTEAMRRIAWSSNEMTQGSLTAAEQVTICRIGQRI